MENTSLISYIYSTFIISFRALLDLDNYSLVVLNSRIVSSTTKYRTNKNKKQNELFYDFYEKCEGKTIRVK